MNIQARCSSTGRCALPVFLKYFFEGMCYAQNRFGASKYVKAIRGKKIDKKDAKWIVDIFKHDLVSGSFIPPADIRQLRDLMRYRWKLTISPRVRKTMHRTVSPFPILNWMVFSQTFSVKRLLQSSRLLEKPTEKITDVSGFRTNGMKAANEEILTAVDGESYPEQAEKLRIIHSHMNDLEL